MITATAMANNNNNNMMMNNKLSMAIGLTVATTAATYWLYQSYRRRQQYDDYEDNTAVTAAAFTATDDQDEEDNSNWSLVLPVRRLCRYVTAAVLNGVGNGSGGGSVVVRVRRQLNTHYVHVPRHLVPGLIGKSGQNIKQLELTTGTSIRFARELDVTVDDGTTMDCGGDGIIDLTHAVTDDDDDDWCDNPNAKLAKRLPDYRTMAIVGEPDRCRQVEEHIRELIVANIWERLELPPGCNIVGNGGETIGRIEQESGARLKVEGSRNAALRSVVIIGDDTERQRARQLVQSVIDEFNNRNNV